MLVNRLAAPSRPGDVAVRWDPSSSANTFHGVVERLDQESLPGVLGTVWLEVWPEIALVR